MEENILAVGKSGYVKKIIGIILALPVLFFYVMGFIILFGAGDASVLIVFFILSIPILLIILACFNQASITVTDKRVFGQATRRLIFSRRMDLPLDSISAVSIGGGIRVATASGEIVFKGISNQDEVYQAINYLLMARQDARSPVAAQDPRPSVPGELKQYKELLDGGVITQEEFDEKKRQLLDT